ncbi:MAG: choice-of-anchor A family protein [Candidatus Synoicihabitans palmerolidicus]|nr:choice-of-anchor A family protein [Candidatus Synoicihabitans palmerolidicus]
MNGSTLEGLPSLYVQGNLNVSGNNQLNNGTAYIPNFGNTTTWNNANQRSLVSGSGSLILDNSSTTFADLTTDPGIWNVATAMANLSAASTALAATQANGTITLSGDKLLFNTARNTGIAVFDYDVSQFGSVSCLNIKINVPADMFYVINVLNADDTNLFAGNNANSGSNSDQLLWNIVSDANLMTSSSVNLGSNLYGSILAPLMDLASNGKYVNGQIVANNYTQTGAEVHHVAFDASSGSFSAVPEPSPWGFAAVECFPPSESCSDGPAARLTCRIRPHH